jgi:serine/threonine protein kinase
MDLSGQVIKGYELHRRIGHGRFAMVYHASQPQVGRDVAVKVFQPEFANHPDFVRSLSPGWSISTSCRCTTTGASRTAPLS